MSFRRPKDKALEAIRWRDFLAAEQELFSSAGLPGAFADHKLFVEFLMEGFVRREPLGTSRGAAGRVGAGGVAGGTFFDLDQLGSEQRKALGELARRYVEEFGDPGLDRSIEHLAGAA